MLRKSSINLFLNDEQIVGLITYIRNTWDNTGPAYGAINRPTPEDPLGTRFFWSWHIREILV